MQLNQDEFAAHLPVYLTRVQKDNLIAALKNFNQHSFYTTYGTDELLQGDGWGQLDIFSFQSGQQRKVRGIFLSNSCDISPENERILPPNIVFVPLIPTKAVVDMLTAKGIAKNKIEDTIKDMRAQRITSVFFLPKHTNGLNEDHIAFLDNVHSLPANHFIQQKTQPKIFTLSQMGFYLFLFKLSVHFCRFGENVQRYDV